MQAERIVIFFPKQSLPTSKRRALRMELGVKPEHAAVSCSAAIEALGKIMPRSKAEAMTQRELFEKAGIITKQRGSKRTLWRVTDTS